MPKAISDPDQRFEDISADSRGYNILGNIFNSTGVNVRSHKLYLFTTFALLLIGLIVCIPTVIVPNARSAGDE